MIKFIKGLWHFFVPQEYKTKAGDVTLRGIDRNGKDFAVKIPTVNTKKGKDGYYKSEVFALPESMRKNMGYGYTQVPELRVIEK